MILIWDSDFLSFSIYNFFFLNKFSIYGFYILLSYEDNNISYEDDNLKLPGFKINFDIVECGNYNITQSCDNAELPYPKGRYIESNYLFFIFY